MLLFAASAWPLAAGAQGERVRRLGVLLSVSPSDPEYRGLIEAFLGRLRELGWTEGRNLGVDVRWSGSAPPAIQKNAVELAALAPDVILAPGSAAAGPLLQVTRTVPVVFTIVPDPLGAGFVDSLARPGGNATGFASFDYGIGGKWLELLKEMAPGVTRVGVLRDPAITAGIGQLTAIEAAAPRLRVEATPINMRDDVDLGRAIAGFAGGGGLIVTSGAPAVRHRKLIVAAAAEHSLPAIYYASSFVADGGLFSYGTDRVDQFRRAADYVDRILRGGNPADLPVQMPVRYELAVNLKTAKALGLSVPPSLLARAEIIVE